MSATPDWMRMEAAISSLLPEAAGASARTQLLATLADYSAAATREARVLGPIAPSGNECELALEWLLRPVFICGHHRSGTTLLQTLLDGHSELLVLPSEGTYFTSFAHVARASPSSAALDSFAAEWIARFIDPNFTPHFRLGRSDVARSPAVEFARLFVGWHSALRSRVPTQFAALLALVAAFHATTAPVARPLAWVEKTPQNERYVRRLAPLAGARFIQLVRDPRATFASLRETYRVNGLGRFDSAHHARAIGRSLRLAIENQRRWGHRYLVVRYEDLIESTEREVERVRRFLDIAPDPALLLPTASGSAVSANSSFGGGAVGVIKPLQQPDRVPSGDSALLGVYTASVSRAFGYDIPRLGPIAGAALRAQCAPRLFLQSSRGALRALMPWLARLGVDRSR